MIDMMVQSIMVNPTSGRQVVVLKEVSGDRCLPVWIGPAEADAIMIKIHEIEAPRPLTHDLIRTVIDELGASVRHVVINDLDKDTFYAKIILNTGGDIEREVDCRPSDAIALALRVKVPIRVEDQVLHRAGILLDKETGGFVTNKDQSTNETSSQGKPPTQEEQEGPFGDFIKSLDLEDFGERK